MDKAVLKRKLPGQLLPRLGQIVLRGRIKKIQLRLLVLLEIRLRLSPTLQPCVNDSKYCKHNASKLLVSIAVSRSHMCVKFLTTVHLKLLSR